MTLLLLVACGASPVPGSSGAAQTELAHTGPAHTGPAHTGPAHIDPAASEGVSTGLVPVPLLPQTSRPVASHPRATCPRCGNGEIDRCTVTQEQHDCIPVGHSGADPLGEVNQQPCLPPPVVSEFCDGSEISVSCSDLGYEGGEIGCNATCLGWDETGCDPCMSSSVVRQCLTTEREVELQFGIATSDTEMLLVRTRQGPTGHALIGERFGPDLESRGEQVIDADHRAMHPTVERVVGGWVVFATNQTTRVYFIPDDGPVRSRDIAGFVASANRSSATDPLVVIRHEGERHILSRLSERVDDAARSCLQPVLSCGTSRRRAADGRNP